MTVTKEACIVTTPAKEQPFRLELLRGEFRVIERRGGDLPALRKALAAKRRMVAKIPAGLVDTVAEVRAIRDSGGRD